MSLLSADSAGDRWRKKRAKLAALDLAAYTARSHKLVEACTVNRSYDQPWLANRSMDGKMVYIDRHVPQILKCGADTSKTLPWHELSEWLAMNDGLDYDDAHSRVATPLERAEVERQGCDWKEYTDEMDGYVRAVDDETIVRVAPDMDLRPFEDDDKALLREIIAKQTHDVSPLPMQFNPRLAASLAQEGDGDTSCVHDASKPRDPTGTGPLRGKFRNDLDRRWAALRRLTTEAISGANILGLGTPTVVTIAQHMRPLTHAPLPGVDKVQGFSRWLDEALRQVVLGNDGTWTARYVNMAAESALTRAWRLINKAPVATSDNSRLAVLRSVTVAELQGICEAVSQQAVRAVAEGLMLRQRPAKIARAVAARINAVGKTRSRQMAAHLIVKTHAATTLDAFRAAGIRHVGIAPERVVKKSLTDASVGWRATSNPKASTIFQKPTAPAGRPLYGKVSRTKGPTASQYKSIMRGEARVRALGRVDVITADDDFVCVVCEDISENGPYDIDEAESLIPAHIHCRCAFVPADDARFAHDALVFDLLCLLDAYNPDQARVPAGQPGGGEFAGGGPPAAHVKVEHQKFILGKKVFRQPGTARTMRWEAVNAYVKEHPDAKLGEIFKNTPYTKADYALDLKRGAVLPHTGAVPQSPGKWATAIEAQKAKFEAPPPAAATPGAAAKLAEAVAASKQETSAPIDFNKLTKVGPQKGSNKGGVYSDDLNNQKYYVKEPATQDHVNNELLAAALYKLAGVPTLDYVPVAGGNHVATKMESLLKDNIYKFNDKQIEQAQSHFGVHAWLANWDAAGTGGDNQGVDQNGNVKTLDVGGALKYRAQGGLKAFGNSVTEFNSMREPTTSPDAAKLFGPMTPEQIAASVSKVAKISDEDIKSVILKNGGDMDLANKMIARKQDLIDRSNKLIVWELKTSTVPAAPAAPSAAEQQLIEAKIASNTAGKNIDTHLGAGKETIKAVAQLGYPASTATSLMKPEQIEAINKQYGSVEAAHAKAEAYAAASSQAAKAEPAAKVKPDELAGLSPQEAETAQILKGNGNNSHDIKYMLGAAKSRIEHNKLSGIEPHEAAFILSYTGSGYHSLNAALRKGTISAEQYAFAKGLDKALDKLPPYSGTVYRKANLPPEQVAKYLPGYIVPEAAFTSTSKESHTWHGSYHYKITATGKNGRDVQPLSLHASEKEVLFKRNSHFRVTKVEGSTIHLEEID